MTQQSHCWTVLPKAHLTSHSRMSGSRWVITPFWLSGSWRSFLYRSSVYSCHLFLISSASVRSMFTKTHISSLQFSHSVLSDSATPWITALQVSLSITNSWSLPKLMCIKSVMPSSHLILCHPLLLLPPIPPSIRVFSSESTLHVRWPYRKQIEIICVLFKIACVNFL